MALDFIDSALLDGGCVLVHCFAGKSRSATLVLAYLIARKQMRLEAALALLQALRPQAQPNSGFLVELALWEQQLESASLEEFEPTACWDSALVTKMALTATMEGGDNSDFGGDDGYDRDLILSRDEFEML
uniref:Tyrosine specific protein phosphatases domain-containing protein n=1 Tax=Globisporangium ultimum (strain ATCC 200006 / CBS 805.95 / DAOM BR144) TaxID=431595 RepID=K3WQR5_GLOUD